MKTKIRFFVLIIVAAFAEAIGDVILKKWSIESKTSILVVGLSIYFIATVIRAYTLKYEFLSKAIAIITILNLIFVIVLGVMLFNEQLEPVHYIGIILGIISVILMQL